jgi:sugar lactone lactonase YvrE
MAADSKPTKDCKANSLCWVDILSGAIHTATPGTGAVQNIRLSTLVGAAVPKSSGGFVAATTEGFADVASDGHATTRIAVLGEGLRMNDAKCDPAGRMWAGSCAMDFAPGRGALHVLTPEWSTWCVLDGLTQPNGLGWSPDGGTFYLIDTAAGELNAFDLSRDGLSPVNRRVLASFPVERGYPDGMTVDASGCLWIALWGGGRLVRLSPQGVLLAEVPLPVMQPVLLCVRRRESRRPVCDDRPRRPDPWP